MYEEDFVRIGDTGHRNSVRHSGEAWNALADFAKKFMEEYYPEDEEVRRSYNRYAYDDDFERGRYRGQPRTSTRRFKRMRYSHERDCEMDKNFAKLSDVFVCEPASCDPYVLYVNNCSACFSLSIEILMFLLEQHFIYVSIFLNSEIRFFFTP